MYFRKTFLAQASLVSAIAMSGCSDSGTAVIDLESPLNQTNPNPTVPQTESGQTSSDLLRETIFASTGESATAGQSFEEKTWSCATCHHAAAGFKSGITQGIGEGGVGFGEDGSQRRLSPLFDGMAEAGSSQQPDIQPFTSPTILNTAYQDVMLWNGQFGNAANSVNSGIPAEVLSTAGTPKEANLFFLSGLETQAIAGLGVHRLNIDDGSFLQTNNEYRQMFQAAYGAGSDNVKRDGAKAVAAFERTVLANQAPFQQWLRGDDSAMKEEQIQGAILFYGKANCVGCHQGPALSSKVGANEADLFMSIGFSDFTPEVDPNIHGLVSENDKNGRGGLTGEPGDNFRFKIPQLYNLADTTVFGHGGSFTDIREIIEYKNRAIPQNGLDAEFLDQRFVPLGLSPDEVDNLQHFLVSGLYDPDLARYQPASVPSGNCVVVDPLNLQDSSFCPDN